MEAAATGSTVDAEAEEAPVEEAPTEEVPLELVEPVASAAANVASPVAAERPPYVYASRIMYCVNCF